MIRIGDRIEVVGQMTDDPLPPPIGAKGKVVDVTGQIINLEDGTFKAHIEWDEGVMAVSALLIPQDNHVYKVIGHE